VSARDDGAQVVLEALARVLAPAIAREVIAQLRAGETPGMVDQSASPLGRRRHIALARTLIAAGSADAARIGRRYLVRREAIDAHATELSKRAPKPKPQAVDELAEMRTRYGLRKAVGT
jgi:hypothetical protein